MQTSEIDRVVYGPAGNYKVIRRRDGFAKLEKMTDADRTAQNGQGVEQSTRASILRWLRENNDPRTVEQFIDDYIANQHDIEKTKAQRKPTYAQAQAAVMEQFTACEPVKMAGNWHHENPAIGTLRKELQRDGDPRTPEQFLRDLIAANDRDASAKFREVRAAQAKLMRQVSGQVE